MQWRIAVIDAGSNSFHLVLATFTPAGDICIEKKYREFVFLSDGLENEHKLTPQAMERAYEVLDRFSHYIRDFGAQKVVAYGTSALRRAQNAQEFLRAVHQATGITIEIISGQEEARLIYKGVRQSLTLPYPEKCLIMDIGGGSTEFIIADAREMFYVESLPMGVSYLKEKFGLSDPLTLAEQERLRAYFDSQWENLLPAIRRFGAYTLIGSSGTFKTLGRLVAQAKKNAPIHRYVLSPLALHQITEKLLHSSLKERLRFPGMEPMRAPLMPIGAFLVQSLCDRVPISQILISEASLKEGILIEVAENLSYQVPQQWNQARERSILGLVEKYQASQTHAQSVRKLAEKLFDALEPLHQLPPKAKEWLGLAALLHDIGHYVNPKSHHKHGQYLILHSPLPLFSSEEILIISNIVRYHRKSLPSSDHFHYQVLARGDKKVVNYLAPLLRLADQLDKYAPGEVTLGDVAFPDGAVRIRIHTSKHISPEPIYEVVEEFFEKSYNAKLVLHFVA
ncbi:MAG: Ppx/GppA phosphatase family protein [Bacteroidia bacterium]